jgi:hypothetical protein
MQLRSSSRRLAAIEDLAVEGMDKFITRGKTSIRKPLRPRRTHDVIPARELFTEFFEVLQVQVCSRCVHALTEAGHGDARHLESPLLLGGKMLDLHFDHLPQIFRDFEIDLLHRNFELPVSLLA